MVYNMSGTGNWHLRELIARVKDVINIKKTVHTKNAILSCF